MLEVQNLTKRYDTLTAVRDLSFSLQPGDIFGFIGSNGAGKTTTIRMLATLLEPTAGTATLNGVDIQRDPMGIRRLIGYMPDFFGLYDDIRVWEYLDFFATIYGVPPKRRKETIDSVLELTDLTIKHNDFVQSLSRGMQQRLCLARCLIHDPAMLLLDEPASGLDPRARAELKELILELGRMGKIVIVSSHILPELAGFCNTVGIIERGTLLAFGPVSEVIKKVQPHRSFAVRLLPGLEVADGKRDKGSTEAAAAIVGHEGVLDVKALGDENLVIEFNGSFEQQADLIAKLIKDGHRVLEFREEHADLEDAFLRLTTGAVQ